MQQLQPVEEDMKFCYCDESGTGDEPIAVMTGILVDGTRMHLTKQDWSGLLSLLSKMLGHTITELHTRNLYQGRGVFHGIDGKLRASLISAIFQWLANRGHHIVYSSVVKSLYNEAFKAQRITDELSTPWLFMGFHVILAIQKHCQRFSGVKGNTVFIFDNKERERMKFTDLIARPPTWSGTYYNRSPKAEPLDKIIDVPYFGDSEEVALIQLADFTSYFLRRYAEIQEGISEPRYTDERERLTEWMGMFMNRSLSRSMIYPRKRGKAEDIFYQVAPPSIRDLE